MNTIKRIIITDPVTKEIRRLFPDQRLQYWDVSVSQERGVYWYYQMNINAVMDLIYAAGKSGRQVTLELDGGDSVELQS